MIRKAKTGDLAGIVAIHNQAIEARFQTCFTEPFMAEQRLPWLKEHLGSEYPLFVYELDGAIAGYASVGGYRQGRNALRHVVEISYFIHKDHQRKGLGSRLLEYTIAQCRVLGYKTALAVLIDGNTGSIKLLEKYGFEQWGYLPDIAEFDGVTCGQLYYGLKL